MRARTPTRLILAFALLLPAVASQATAPDDTDFRADLLDKVKAVCANNPSQVCTTRLTSTSDPSREGEFDPAQCPATPAPQACVVDYLPNIEIRSLMTVSGDDASDGVVVSVLLEFQIGEKHFVVEQQFPAGEGIFGWNPIFNESDVFTIGSSFNSTNHGSTDINTRLVEIAVAELGVPANSIPVLQSADRKTPELEINRSSQSTGSVARYRISIRFAKPAP